MSLCGVVDKPRSRSLIVRGLSRAARLAPPASARPPHEAAAAHRRTPPAAQPRPLLLPRGTGLSTQTIRGRPAAVCRRPAQARRDVKGNPRSLAPGLNPRPCSQQLPPAHRSQFSGCQFRERSFMFMERPRCLPWGRNDYETGYPRREELCPRRSSFPAPASALARMMRARRRYPADVAPMAGGTRGHPLRGRAAEVAAIGARLDEVRSGVGSVIIVEGRPGLGRTPAA